MARTAADTALILQAIAHYDAQDIHCQRFPPVFYPSAMEESTAALRLGLARDFWNDLDDEVCSAVNTAVSVFTQLTSSARDISLSTIADRTLVGCEAYVYHQQYLPAHENDYDPETLRRIRSGADVTVAQYVQARHDLLRQRREILHLFDQVDLVITPTTPHLPPSFAELESAPNQLRSRELIMLRNTRPFNVLGLPSISICCGFSRSGLPIGVQISSAPGADGLVLALAHSYQKQTGWHKKTPPTA